MMHYETQVVEISPSRPEPGIIEQAAELIRKGELVVFPTETVYGLGADALQVQAAEGIFAAKGRPFSDPLIVHIADETALKQLVRSLPEAALPLAQAFWPGPLTLILPASSQVPSRITAGLPTVAVRMPRHPVARALIRASRTPIAAPSANRFMHVSPTTAQHALDDLAGRVPLILDGGPCEVGVESTILDLCAEVPTVLRPGGITLAELRQILPQVQGPLPRSEHAEGHDEDDSENHALKAPGQLPIHYAPNVPTYLVEGTPEQIHALMQAELHRYRQQNERVGLLLAQEDVEFFAQSDAQIYNLGSVEQPELIATTLFRGLRALEESGVQVILCRNFSLNEQGIGLAIRDRLLKASGGKVIR